MVILTYVLKKAILNVERALELVTNAVALNQVLLSIIVVRIGNCLDGGMADTIDSKSIAEKRVGSSPSLGTNVNIFEAPLIQW